MTHFTLPFFPLDRKRVLVRVDYNVPLEKGKVTNNYRIRSSLPTLQFLLEKDCQIILMAHLGRPEGKFVASLKTDAVAKELQKLLPKNKVVKLDDCIGPEIKARIEKGRPEEIFILENLRFYKAEEENNPVFGHSLAELADVYVNDAFAVSHRKQASVSAITTFLPSLAGLLLEKEITELGKAIHPQRPSVWIIGGAKLDKIEFLQKALQQADYILVGGALAFSFLKAKGISVGMSRNDSQSTQIAAKILKQRNAGKIVLPLDLVAADQFSVRSKTQVVNYNHIKTNQVVLDVGPKTIELFKTYLRKARTIIWNGPLGYYEWAQFATGTKEIGRFLGKLTATSIIGGGETAEAFQKFYMEQYCTHLSTGGGASIEFLSGKKLPGIEALEKNYSVWKKKLKPSP